MEIPSHYFNGSYGAINPAEVAAARIYNSFDERVTAGMNQYVATGNQAEAACALAQLDAWARAKQLLDYNAKTDSQAWFTAGWALCSAAITESVLRQDRALDPQQQARVIAWLRSAAHTLISWEKTDARGNNGNNLHYWRALAAIATGVLADDNDLFRFGVDTYKQAINEIDANGALPLEMKRHENSIHYQAFALQPLVMIAEFAARQHVDLYAVSAHGRTIRDAIRFLGRAMADPTVVRPYTTDPQKLNFSSGDIAELNFYVARFGAADLSSSIATRLSHPASDKWVGGNTTVLATK
jgi:poly(beta-D-mannuronate) lyase